MLRFELDKQNSVAKTAPTPAAPENTAPAAPAPAAAEKAPVTPKVKEIGAIGVRIPEQRYKVLPGGVGNTFKLSPATGEPVNSDKIRIEQTMAKMERKEANEFLRQLSGVMDPTYGTPLNTDIQVNYREYLKNLANRWKSGELQKQFNG
jgi:hypothetical protein